MICAENLEFQFFPHTIFLRNHVSYVLSSRVFTNFSRRTKVSMHYPPMQCEEGKKSFRHIGMLSKKNHPLSLPLITKATMYRRLPFQEEFFDFLFPLLPVDFLSKPPSPLFKCLIRRNLESKLSRHCTAKGALRNDSLPPFPLAKKRRGEGLNKFPICLN